MQAVSTNKGRGVINLTAGKHHRHAHGNEHVVSVFALVRQCLIASQDIVQRGFGCLIKFLIAEVVFTPVTGERQLWH